LTKHSGSISAYVKKAEIIGRAVTRKVATSRKSKTHFSLWAFDYNFHDALL